jgi:putative DNA primase/helicase
LEAAWAFCKARYWVEEVLTLRRQQGEFYKWNGRCYEAADPGSLRAELYEFLATAEMACGGGVIRIQPDAALVSKIMDALEAVVNIDAKLVAPAWLGGEAPVENLRELVACENGLLYMPDRLLLPHNPKFWSHNALDFKYDPWAKSPQWNRFLGEVFPGDEESIDTLQEIMGLGATDETRFEKGFGFIGVTRAGKGTIIKVWRAIVGERNCTSPPLSSFAGRFGLQSAIGKKLLFMPDARKASLSNQAKGVVTEGVLSVCSGDPISVERKNIPDWEGILYVRIVYVSNEPPEFNDSAGVVHGRWIMLNFTQSFAAAPDLRLKDKLLEERAGIFNWMLDGWERLSARGYFIQPESGKGVVAEIRGHEGFRRSLRTEGPAKAWKARCRLEDEGIA